MIGAMPRGSNWTPEEDRRLLELVEAKKSWVFISLNLKRPEKSVRDHLAFMRRQARMAAGEPLAPGRPKAKK